ncbi:MAG: glycosyltransferase family 4 protein [Actinomycetia bacterium]|nr:glycosyltransferase family 4 protein [Actinomycetes bacterium]
MIWSTFVISTGLSLTLTPCVIALLRRGQVYDQPNERSSHSRPTPRGGGLATALAALIALAATWTGASGPAVALAFTATGFGIVGMMDDFHDLSANLRLIVQVVLGAAAAFLLLRGTDLSPLVHGLAMAAIVVWLMSFVNAFNFMDGIDGMSIAQSAVAGAAWAVLGWASGESFLLVAGLAQLGAAIGFAPFNVPVAKVFLGDVGSYFLGGWMGALVVLGLRAGLTPEAVLAPLGLYLLDTGTTLFWRIRSGHEWRRPHRYHVYQRLADHGWSHVRTAGFAAGIIALCALLGGLSESGSLTGRIIADIGLALTIIAYLDWPEKTRNEISVKPLPTGGDRTCDPRSPGDGSPDRLGGHRRRSESKPFRREG